MANMAILKSVFLALGLSAILSAAQNNQNYPYLNGTTIHQPRRGVEELTYPRYVELLDGTILVTASHGTFGQPSSQAAAVAAAYFPVFASSDGGASWDWISNITDQVNGWGMGAQPALMELTEPIGEYAEGTILAAGNSWSENGTHIDVYASMDKGSSWEFVSNVAKGNAPNTTNGAHPIWEPYLMLYDHQLICYYSDQRDPLHGQKLAHQVTTDAKSWGPVVNDVAYPTYSDRPGMTIITQLPDTTWILVHEYPGGYTLGLANYPVFYHIAPTPLDFITDPGRPIIANGFQPSSSPYVVWSSCGGPNGTIVVSDADHSGVFINTMLGDETGWRYKVTEARPAYSRALAVWRNQPKKLATISGAMYGDGETNRSRPLSLWVEDLEGLVRQNPPPEGRTPIQIYYSQLDRDGA
ncbi:uncharacterized protein LTR77_005334 [Saxophila tyrrhenica]|uniref:Glycoside hydrolase family 93 protein n=1 Tax=Saxophila tyrrhenica TaxID=1690608 RepID=A0AAV9PBN2_9PEZI|nr:hypothetical protein LTR77_005334 [Saxophila tyrrhenica]